MKYTENLKLKKPDQKDLYQVDDFNENVDKIDDVLSKIASKTQLGRVIIGKGIAVNDGVISLEEDYYTESEIDNKLQELLDKMTIEDLESLIGDNYKGHYNANTKYYNGDIYYKKDTTTLSLTIPDKLSNTIAFLIPAVASPALTKEMTSEDKGSNSSPALTKSYQISDIKKFFRLYGEAEREYNFTDNSDNKIIGFAVEDSNRLIRTNSTVIFEIPNDSNTALSKTQSDTPVYSHDTQRSPILRKFNY